MPLTVRPAVRALLRPVDRAVPEKYRLPYEVLRHRVAGRLEPEVFLLGSLVRERALALDVGANRGYYSYFLAKLFRRVEAFEPNAAVLGPLRAWGAPNLAVHNVALSSGEGEMELYVPLVNGSRLDGWASFDRDNLAGAPEVEVVRVPVRPLDSYGFRSVSLVKMDVEGHEEAVLQGARKTIEESLPTVLVEVKARNRGAVFSFFEERGYGAWQCREGKLVPAEAGGEGENYVFRPRRGP